MKKHVRNLLNSVTHILISKGLVVYPHSIGFDEPEVVANVVKHKPVNTTRLSAIIKSHLN